MVVKHILDIHKALIDDNFLYRDIYLMVVNDIMYEYLKLLQKPLFVILWEVTPQSKIAIRKKELFDSYMRKLSILSQNDKELGLIVKKLLQKSNETETGTTRCPLCDEFTRTDISCDDMVMQPHVC